MNNVNILTPSFEGKNGLRLYEGRRFPGRVMVTVNGDTLKPRFDLCKHNPDGFEWGYGGSAPAQLALALLADHFQGSDKAIALHQAFKWAIVTRLPRDSWKLTSYQIERAVHLLGDTGPHINTRCATCGAFWDTSYLRYESITGTRLSTAEIEKWRLLPAGRRLGSRYREAFKNAGFQFQFGDVMIDVRRCPMCVPGLLHHDVIRDAISEILGTDEYQIASTLMALGI